MPQANVNGTTLVYNERGQGPPLVLLHGFPLDGRIFAHQLEALADRWRVIVPDLRGFGRSRSNEPFTVASLAEDVHALLEQLGALPCALGGLSMGGYVAFAYAKKYPTDLSALLLIDTRCEGDTAEGKANRDKMIESVRQGGAKAVAEQMFPKMLAPGAAERDAAVAGRAREIMEQCPPLTIEHALAAMRDRDDYCSLLPSIPVPTLIIVGEHDAITPPAGARTMHEHIPRSQLAVIPDAGHLSPLEKRREVNEALRGFLAFL
jgi:3-oxoadipate enol-lactonase